MIHGRGNSSSCRSWGGHREGVVVGKCFRKGSYRKSRNNLLGRRHQPWRWTEDGQQGILVLFTPKSSACPCPPSPSLAGLCAATAALGNPPEQDTGTGVQSSGRRAWKRGCNFWGPGHRAQDTGHACGSALPHGTVVFAITAMPCVPCTSYFMEELGTAKEQVSGVFKFFLFIYCFDILMLIFSLIFPPPVSSCVGSYHGEIGLWV